MNGRRSSTTPIRDPRLYKLESHISIVCGTRVLRLGNLLRFCNVAASSDDCPASTILEAPKILRMSTDNWVVHLITLSKRDVTKVVCTDGFDGGGGD